MLDRQLSMNGSQYEWVKSMNGIKTPHIPLFLIPSILVLQVFSGRRIAC